jgi:hypothetical protein
MSISRSMIVAAMLLLIGSAAGPVTAQVPSADAADAQPTLEGRSFPGLIRAKGPLGLFSVKGRLAFEDGNLVWTARGTREAAPYQVQAVDGGLKFMARLPAEQGTHVDWSGRFDGEALSEVEAVWDRSAEDDFFHDLLLPDVVTLVFKPREG